MKTYTLTWFRPDTWRKNGLCRCRFDALCPLWFVPVNCSPIEAFASVLSGNSWIWIGERNFRLSCCGKLIARQATYQGV